MDRYTVVVDNIGTVFRGDSFSAAETTFEVYSNCSKNNVGKAAGQNVTLYIEGEPYRYHIGFLSGVDLVMEQHAAEYETELLAIDEFNE